MYELNSAFWYKFVFMAELLLAEAVIVFRLKRRRLFALRFVLALIGAAGLCFAVPVFPGIWNAFVYLLLFGISIGALVACFDERIIKIVFCAVAAYKIGRAHV